MLNIEHGIMNVEGMGQIRSFLILTHQHGKQVRSTVTAKKNKDRAS